MKQLLLIIFFLCSLNLVAQKPTQINLVQQDENSCTFEITLGDLNVEQIFAYDNFSEVLISIDKGIPITEKNAPDLPKIVLPIQLPNNLDVSVNIVPIEIKYENGVVAFPSLGKVNRTQNKYSLPHIKGDVYTKDEFYPKSDFEIGEPFIQRNLRAQTISIFPVKNNPVSKTVLYYQKFLVEVNFDKPSKINILANTFAENSNEFKSFQENNFVNFNTNENNAKYTFVSDLGSILVLSPAKYIDAIAPYIKWKNQKGQKTILVNIDTLTGGINTQNLKSLVDNFYNVNHNTFLVLVGDNTDVPTINENLTSGMFGGPSDNAYGYISGSDHYQEIIVGRFSGETVAQISSQVKKCLDYELNPNSNGWMQNLLAIGSNEGTGDDNQYDWEHERDIADSNVSQGTFLNKIELYDGSHGTPDADGNPNNTDVTNAFNSGIGLVNYTGHGTVNGIVTTYFHVGDVPSLNNTNNNWPFMITVGCDAGMFVNYTCFAEALARATDSENKPTGTIANVMSTIQQDWDPPMQAQDEMNAYIRNARPDKTFTYGGLFVNGLASMNDDYNSAIDPNYGNFNTDTWTYFGDPAQVVNLKYDGAISCTHLDSIPTLATNFTISSPIDGATVCLYQNGKILDVQKITGGSALLTFNPLTDSDTIWVTATKQNYKPYIHYILKSNLIDTSANDIFYVAPNPAKDIIKIVSSDGIENFVIYDTYGKIIANKNSTVNIEAYDIKHLSSGNYFVRVKTKTETKVFRIVKY